MLALRFNGRNMSGALDTDVDRILSNLWGGFPRIRDHVFSVSNTALQMREDDDNVFVEAALPGVKSDELDISVVGRDLTVKGERACARDEGDVIRRRERVTGAFCQSVRLPREVNVEAISATLQDGMLTVTLPKAESAKPRKIEVNVNK